MLMIIPKNERVRSPIHQILAPSFLNRFNYFRISRPDSPVLVCYTRIRGEPMLSSIACNPRPTTTTQASASPFGVASYAVVAAGRPPGSMLFPAPGPRPLAPGSRIQLKLRRLQNSIRIIELPTVRVTHLAQKALPMRHPLAPHHRNPLKNRSLKPDELNSTPPGKMRHPDGARGGGRTALQPLFSPWQAPGIDRHEVNVKVRRARPVERRATIALSTRRPS
jgi:hypothetical protein